MSNTLTEAGRAVVVLRSAGEQSVVNGTNTLCPGLGFSCRHTLTPHHECAAFTPVMNTSTLLFTCVIRFRTRTTTWSCERSIQLVVTGCFAVKKATEAGGVGWICGNRRWFVTNNSPIVIRQRHSITGTRPTHCRPCVGDPRRYGGRDIVCGKQPGAQAVRSTTVLSTIIWC